MGQVVQKGLVLRKKLLYYFKAEHDAFKRKLYLRAKDLAGELTNEFLIEERSRGFYSFYSNTFSNFYLGEWNQVSKIAKPKKVKDDERGTRYHYTPLYKWANDERLISKSPNRVYKTLFSKKYKSKQTGFYFLDEHEMTFNKERHPDPTEIQHYITFKHFHDQHASETEHPAVVNELISNGIVNQCFDPDHKTSSREKNNH